MPMYSKCSIGTTHQCMGEKAVILSVVAWCRHTYYTVAVSASAASGSVANPTPLLLSPTQ